MSKNTTLGDGVDLAKKHGAKAAIGLNAAALIFLYSHFVPVREFRTLQATVAAQEAEIDKLQQQVGFLRGKTSTTTPADPRGHAPAQ